MTKMCGECGVSAGNDARFCGNCGAVLATEVNPIEDDSWVALAANMVSVPPPVPVVAVPASVDQGSMAEPNTPAEVDRNDDPHIARGAIDAQFASTATEDDDAAEPLRERRIGKAIWIVAIVFGLFAAGVIVAWTVGWTRGPSFATVASGNDDPASPDEEWRNAYTDDFIGTEPVTMVSNALANVRDLPTTTGSQIVRSVPESSEIAGRWVRGRDATTRWLKLAAGGYIWEGNLAEPGGANSPIRIPFSNRDYGFGTDIDHYMDQARAQSSARSERVAALPEKERELAYGDLEAQSFYATVPNRRWRGVTVTAVAQHYEAGSIYFREDIAALRAAFHAAQIRFDNDGIIDGNADEPVSCSIGATEGDERSHGASALTCGV